MSRFPHNATIRQRIQGVTLVELLVALVLGLLLTAGMIQVFVGNRVTYAFNDSLSRIQENARFSLDHIAYNTRMAGYRGCLSDVAVFNNLTGPDNFRDDIANGIQGYNANGTSAGQTFAAGAMNPAPSANAGDWTPALPAELVPLVIPGSDVLVVRSISGTTNSLVTPFSSATQLVVSTPHNFQAGDILVAMDCQKAAIFQLTGTSAAALGQNLLHTAGGGFTPGNNIGNWPAEQDFGLGSEVARLDTHAFYIGQGANNAPALFQRRLQRLSGTSSDFASEELVSNIDTLQIRYGLDGDGDDDIDSYVGAEAVADWTTVLNVELTMLGRADDEYGTEIDTTVYNLVGTQFNPVNDRRLRQVFSTTVGVRNRLP